MILAALFVTVAATIGILLLAQPGIAAEVSVKENGSFKLRFDVLIAEVARRLRVPPSLLKAIVHQESGFNPQAINPERTFALDGVNYGPNSRKGRAELRAFILAGGNPLKLSPRVNPSIGLAQVRIAIARAFIPGVSAKLLFNTTTNLTASASLLRELLNAGITMDTIDAYNVGQDLKPRNFPYRDRVRALELRYRKDF